MKRPRVKTNTKGKRWIKGQSCVSNPEANKFRKAAKERYLPLQPGEPVPVREGQSNPPGWKGQTNTRVKEDGSVVSGSFNMSSKTFASDWSECSNKSFDNFMRGFEPTNPLHVEMLAAISGVTEYLQSKAGAVESNDEYFLCLMAALDKCSEESNYAAVLALLALLIKKVSPNILRVRFTEFSMTFGDILVKFQDKGNAVILKSLLICLSTMLKVQDVAAWKTPSTTYLFNVIISFGANVLPKVRKVAQQATAEILKFTESENGIHPAATAAGKFVLDDLINKKTRMDEISPLLYHVNLLKLIMNFLPAQEVKSIIEHLLSLTTAGNATLTKVTLHTLQVFIMSKPTSKSFPPDLNGKLVGAMFKFQPSSKDTDLMLLWLSVLSESLTHLISRKPQICLEYVPRFVKVCSGLLCLENDVTLISGSALALKVVVLECLLAKDVKLDADARRALKAATQSSLDSMEECLKFRHKATWKYAVHALQAIYQVISLENEAMLNRTLKLLAGIRQQADYVDEGDLCNEIDRAVGALVKNLGPELVLSKIPLQISGNETSLDFPSSWIIPVLKNHIEVTTLAFFHHEIIPKIEACFKKWKELEKEGNVNGAHIFHLLFVQLWSIFPSCCTGPTDFKYFKKIAQLLGNALNEDEIAIAVMSGLRKLIAISLEDSEKKQLLGGFSKNYIPILCTMYTDMNRPENNRLASLATVTEFLKISDSGKHIMFFDKAVAKLDQKLKTAMSKAAKGSEVEQTSKKQAKKNRIVENNVQDAILQLLVVLTPFQDESRLAQIINLCSHLVLSSDHSEQKRAYRIIEQICSSEHGGCKAFLEKNMNNLVELVSVADTVCKNPGRTARFRCLMLMSEHLEPQQGAIMSQMMTEGLLGCRNEKPKCRQIAFSLLVQLSKVRQRWTKESDNEALVSSVKVLLNSCQTVYPDDKVLVSASILAISALIHQQKESASPEILKLAMPAMATLAAISIREVSKAVLSFYKCVFAVYDTAELAQYITSMVTTICDMSDSCKKYLRVATKQIFERIVRKFGIQTLEGAVPDEDKVMQKRIKNLRKELERKARAKNADEPESDDEDDLEAAFSMTKKPQTIESVLAECDSDEEYEKIMDNSADKKPKKRKMMDTWIQESDDVIDFTDPVSMQRISAKRPGKPGVAPARKVEQNRGFKCAPDGRLIIEESDEEFKAPVIKKKRHDDYSDDDQDIDDLDEAAAPQKGPLAAGYVMQNSKDLSQSMEDLTLQNKYKPGGSGIHRPIPGVHTGSEYKASKAKGDIKKKGRHDPYAYIPLSGALLNKRKRAKNAGKLLNLEKAAAKGVAKGLKAKAKQRRNGASFKKSL
ncbi:Hypothetical predicted protein [Cloeon dipterum]|uniref:Ribosomal RNA-processing protein 12-like conserved domain-containing protein n=1 Tax=Cloeon dipterum TaxID=197152 RepID=A0A8S1CH82_9INSE|nr:Hypothetical predicted protein [Cloeon dipterum]